MVALTVLGSFRMPGSASNPCRTSRRPLCRSRSCIRCSPEQVENDMPADRERGQHRRRRQAHSFPSDERSLPGSSPARGRFDSATQKCATNWRKIRAGFPTSTRSRRLVVRAARCRRSLASRGKPARICASLSRTSWVARANDLEPELDQVNERPSSERERMRLTRRRC